MIQLRTMMLPKIPQTVGLAVCGALLHGEALLVITSGYTEHIALEFIPQSVSLHLLAHPLLIERPHLKFISNLNKFLTPCSRVRQVNLHPSLSCRSESSNKSL